MNKGLCWSGRCRESNADRVSRMKGYQAMLTLSELHEVLLSYIRFLTLEENLKVQRKKKLKYGMIPPAAFDVGEYGTRS